jgi:hypothetical protein
MESEKPKAEENGDKCNPISSAPKFLTLPNMLTLGRVAAVPLLIAGEFESLVYNLQRKLLSVVFSFASLFSRLISRSDKSQNIFQLISY